MAKGDELVKYITQQVVTYMDTPKDVRRKQRQEKRTSRQEAPWVSRWFGVLPISLRLWFRSRKNSRLFRRKMKSGGM